MTDGQCGVDVFTGLIPEPQVLLGIFCHKPCTLWLWRFCIVPELGQCVAGVEGDLDRPVGALVFKGHEELLHGVGGQRGDQYDAKQDGQLHAWAKEFHPGQAEGLLHSNTHGATVGIKAFNASEGLDRR